MKEMYIRLYRNIIFPNHAFFHTSMILKQIHIFAVGSFSVKNDVRFKKKKYLLWFLKALHPKTRSN